MKTTFAIAVAAVALAAPADSVMAEKRGFQINRQAFNRQAKPTIKKQASTRTRSRSKSGPTLLGQQNKTFATPKTLKRSSSLNLTPTTRLQQQPSPKRATLKSNRNMTQIAPAWKDLGKKPQLAQPRHESLKTLNGSFIGGKSHDKQGGHQIHHDDGVHRGHHNHHHRRDIHLWFPIQGGYCRPIYHAPVAHAGPIVEQPVATRPAAGLQVVEEATAEPLPQVAVGTTLQLTAEQFGAEAGQVLLQVGDVVLQAAIVSWSNEEVVFTLPRMGLTGPTKATIAAIKTNGTIGRTIDVELIAADKQAD